MKTMLVAVVLGVAASRGSYCPQPPPRAEPTGFPAEYPRYPFPPIDQAEQEPDLKLYREQLIRALGTRDLQAILEGTISGARERLAVSASIGKNAEDWGHLQRLLSLGGSFTTTRGAQPGRREFCAPYTYSAYPKPRPDGFNMESDPWAIIVRRAAFKAEPTAASPVLLTLSYELVDVTGGEMGVDDPQWFEIVAPDGREGWVAASEIRNPEDYHACFAKVDGKWLMTVFGRGSPFP